MLEFFLGFPMAVPPENPVILLRLVCGLFFACDLSNCVPVAHAGSMGCGFDQNRILNAVVMLASGVLSRYFEFSDSEVENFTLLSSSFYHAPIYVSMEEPAKSSIQLRAFFLSRCLPFAFTLKTMFLHVFECEKLFHQFVERLT